MDHENVSLTESNCSLNLIKEGKAEILEPPGNKVFYNPVQEFNRDLSVLLLSVYAKELQDNEAGDKKYEIKTLRILEALSATGLRSIRYAKEVPHVTQVVANDISEKAVESIKKNVKFNQVEHIVESSHSDAMTVMFNNRDHSKRFQVIDLDPYGSPTQFLDLAVQCIEDGGILLVTCTDMAILCGNFPETCYVKYGAIPLKTQAHHEMAIRIVLQSIQSQASKYKRYIAPLLSVSVDFYVRVFVKIYTSAAACKGIMSKLSMVYKCTSCDSLTLQPLGMTKQINEKNFKHFLPHAPPTDIKCIHCGGNHHMGGPIWNGPIHDQNFVNKMLLSKVINDLGTSKRLTGLLSLIREELDVPFYYNTAKLSSALQVSTIPMMTIRSAVLNANYRVSYSHACKQSLKTDAPVSFIWDIMKEWAKENSSKKLKPGTPGDNIFKQPIQNKVDFSLRPDANPLSRELKLTRYQVNPMPFWGPGTKSTTKTLIENPKKTKNQSKNKLKRKLNSNNNSNKEPKLEN